MKHVVTMRDKISGLTWSCTCGAIGGGDRQRVTEAAAAHAATDVLELAQAFVDMYDDAGLDGVSDEMTRSQLEAANKHWATYEACKALLLST